jgi:hypothetical protein
MTWIQTIPPAAATGELADFYRQLYALYPPEYGLEVAAVTGLEGTADSIMAAHSLLPRVMFHIFSAHAELMSPDLPLTRRQHEMIATLVSALNRCFY